MQDKYLLKYIYEGSDPQQDFLVRWINEHAPEQDIQCIDHEMSPGAGETLGVERFPTIIRPNGEYIQGFEKVKQYLHGRFG